MKKQQLYRFSHFIFILTMTFSTLVFSGVECRGLSTVSQTQSPAAEARKTDVVPANSKIFSPNGVKKPETKTTAQSTIVLKKEEKWYVGFLKAMLGVLFSSLALYGGLNLYKTFVLKTGSNKNNKKNISPLESPKTFKDALNSFLGKTDK